MWSHMFSTHNFLDPDSGDDGFSHGLFAAFAAEPGGGFCIDIPEKGTTALVTEVIGEGHHQTAHRRAGFPQSARGRHRFGTGQDADEKSVHVEAARVQCGWQSLFVVAEGDDDESRSDCGRDAVLRSTAV